MQNLLYISNCVTGFLNCLFQQNTRFLHIIPGTYRLSVYRRTNPGTAIIDTNIRLNSGTSNTLVILGTIGNYSIQMISS